MGNSELEVFILMWSLKLEGGGSDFRERTGWRRKAQRKAHGGVKLYLKTPCKCMSSHRGEYGKSFLFKWMLLCLPPESVS